MQCGVHWAVCAERRASLLTSTHRSSIVVWLVSVVSVCDAEAILAAHPAASQPLNQPTAPKHTTQQRPMTAAHESVVQLSSARATRPLSVQHTPLTPHTHTHTHTAQTDMTPGHTTSTLLSLLIRPATHSSNHAYHWSLLTVHAHTSTPHTARPVLFTRHALCCASPASSPQPPHLTSSHLTMAARWTCQAAFALLSLLASVQSCALAQQTLYPGAIYNAVSFYAPPTTIPANGFLTAVVEYSSNCSGSVIVHLEVSDVSQQYFLDSRQIQTIATPSYGSLQFVLPPFVGLTVNDSYLMSAFMVCSAASAANGGTNNDWEISLSTAYQGLTVAAIPSTPSFTMYNPPTIVPNSGLFTLYGYWSSAYVGYNSLHVDLTDIGLGYVNDGHAYVNVSSPGSGVVIFTINITTAGALPANNNIEIDWYMTQGNWTNALGTGNDYAHPSASGSVSPITSLPLAQLTNSVSIIGTPSFPGTAASPQAPTTIAVNGPFPLQLQWLTAVAGVYNVHLDLSDASNSSSPAGSWATQVVGPGGGVLVANLSYSAAGGNLTAGHSYSLRTYLTPQNNTFVFGSASDSQHSVAQSTIALLAVNNWSGGGGNSASSSGSSSLSHGAIAGIVIGSVVGVLLLAVLLYLMCMRTGDRYKKSYEMEQSQRQQSQQHNKLDEHGAHGTEESQVEMSAAQPHGAYDGEEDTA